MAPLAKNKNIYDWQIFSTFQGEKSWYAYVQVTYKNYANNIVKIVNIFYLNYIWTSKKIAHIIFFSDWITLMQHAKIYNPKIFTLGLFQIMLKQLFTHCDNMHCNATIQFFILFSWLLDEKNNNSKQKWKKKDILLMDI